MNAGNGQLALLLRALEALAKERTTLPTLDAIGARIGALDFAVNRLIGRAEKRGLLVAERDAEGRRTALAAPDGSWRLAARDSTYARDAEAKPKPRRCLRCRQSFQPDHRHNFVCDACNRLNANCAA